MPIIVLRTGSSICGSGNCAATAPVEFPETGIGQPVNRVAVIGHFRRSGKQQFSARAGCALRYANGDVECTGNPGPVGALLPMVGASISRLPFSFPFRGLVKGVRK